jgi:hypothetical protein
MWNKKMNLATLALGTVLTLAGPAVASAQNRDDFRQRDNRNFTTSFRNREIERQREIERIRIERERLAQRWNRNRYRNSYFNGNDHRTYSDGYYDNANRSHPYR